MRKLETVVDLLEAIREERGWSSDNQLAKGLGVPQQTVSNWRAGTRTPGDDHSLKIAEVLDTSPLLVIAIAAAERAKNARSKKIWQLVAKNIAEQVERKVLPTLAALALLSGGYAPPVKAEGPGVYIKSNRRRRSQEALQPA